MALLVAIVLAVFVVPSPWGYVLVGAAAVWEVASNWWQWRWSRTRRPAAGPATLVGRAIEIDDDGWARVDGERWQVRGAEAGERARIVSVDGVTLVVEREI